MKFDPETFEADVLLNLPLEVLQDQELSRRVVQKALKEKVKILALQAFDEISKKNEATNFS